jgi:hypothetical protein
LDLRGGRYPLAVEAPVMAMVETLAPGVSTLTRFARYYALYWALAAFASERDLDAVACQTLLRRAEVGLAWASLEQDEATPAHGADRVTSMLARGDSLRMAELGSDSYSPRAWGFWSQYNGPSATLGTTEVKNGALRPGRHACPDQVRAMFDPLLEVAAARPVTEDDLGALAPLALNAPATLDVAPLRELMTATREGRFEPEVWAGNDHTRRATYRILVRAVQLQPEARSWDEAVRASVAYGDAVATDSVLRCEERSWVWRGVLLRHHSVGAWRRLWASLVDQVRDQAGSATREDLYDWITAEVPSSTTVGEFVASCPAPSAHDGHPSPAEEQVRRDASPVQANLAILLLGGQRAQDLTGRTLAAFLGRRRGARGQFLDPTWIASRGQEYQQRPVTEFARALVDDMLAQARRVALRKLRIDGQGRMTLFTKLHERNGRYHADSAEGAGNVGLRIDQLGTIAEQLGLLSSSPTGLAAGPSAAEYLELPA